MTPPPQPTPASTPSPAAFPVAPPTEPEHRGDRGHRTSVTFSLIGLLVDPTLVEVTAEYALSRKLGVALTGGYANGRDKVDDPVTGESDADEIHLRIIEGGGSVRYYLVGSYDHGMQVGSQARYFQLEAEGVGGGGFDGSATGISAGPFIGYKKTARFGLTFDSQLGVSYSSWRTKLNDGNGSSVRYADDGLGLLLNLNLGWAF